MTNFSQLCPCCSGLTYEQCCLPFHRGEKTAPTAQVLMRSRYTAYVLRDADYLRATWDAKKCPKLIDFSKETAHWTTLDVLETTKGTETDTKGLVNFKAFYQDNGEECVLHEISRFEKQNGQWVYVDGVIKALGKINAQVNLGKMRRVRVAVVKNSNGVVAQVEPLRKPVFFKIFVL